MLGSNLAISTFDMEAVQRDSSQSDRQLLWCVSAVFHSLSNL
jgi:hypothetical protein